MQYKRCTACGFEHPVTSFYADQRRPNKLRPECKSCYSYRNKMDYKKRMIEVKAPAPRVNVWEWIKRLFG